jgi:predicted dinucleotide-binding enzyme
MATIAILGSGNVGGALGRRLELAGHTVLFGGREPGQSASAAAAASVVLVCVPAAAALDAVRAAGDLTGKIVVDCTNPLTWSNGPVWSPPAGSNAAAIAAALPGVSVLKAFNHFGAEVMAQPNGADACVAGDDASAKATVLALARDMGFTPRDAGPLRNAAVLENLAVLWIHLATQSGMGRQFYFAFKTP